MNKAGIEHESKYPLTTQNLEFIQDIIFSVAKLSEIGGKNYILSGCRQSGDSVSDGIIVINGEIMPFNGGAAGSTVIVVEEKGSTTADGHTYTNARVKRYARFGTGATTYPWSDFKPLATNTQLKQEKADISYVDQELAKVNSGAIPTGAIIMWSGSEAKIPTGWTLCDGKTLPSMVKVPDLRGRFVVGYNSTEGSGYTSIGPGTKLSKDYNITLSPDNMPKHNHGTPEKSEPVAAGEWGIIRRSKTGEKVTAPSFNDDKAGSEPDISSSPQSIVLPSNGNNLPFDARPPYYVLAYILKM